MSQRKSQHSGEARPFQCYYRRVSVSIKLYLMLSQIHQACRQANDLDMRMADAVEARISLDLRIGAAFTRLITLTLQQRVPEVSDKVLSYGESTPLCS